MRNATTEFLETPTSDNLQDQLRSELEILLRSRGDQVFSDAMLVEVVAGVPGTILIATDPDLEGASSIAIQNLPTDSLITVPVAPDPVLAPNSLAFLTSTPVRISAATEVDALIVGINSRNSAVTLLNDIQVFWQKRGVYQVETGRTYLAISPDTLAILPPFSP